ncbi:glycosyl hydrolase family 32 [Vibrio albus]|uniref:Glycosyl hydrolase family 32 n=1 Tax=Vibrio albus TaxID=2200953 RepID=A0A2U3B748_9VIBR|nr:glycoside hydrolase family 32 protein [Vibrio albus]PWI32611.1 glycosyl hydrolase family 32 [Vibrio albus]
MAQLTGDLYRPSFHFSPPFGWMNDPNGLVRINDEYHLFYQYHPFDTVWGPMHWGHAVSEDFINWTHMPVALAPDERGACFSGSAVVDRNNSSGLFDEQAEQPGVVAFYTANYVPEDGSNWIQSQHIACSQDGGIKWDKIESNPVVDNPGLKDFRDPKVSYHDESGAWIMVVSEGQDIGFYRSEDMLSWEKTSVFGATAGAHDEFALECPDLFSLQLDGKTHWVLVVGVQQCGPVGGTGTQYFVGTFDGYQFVNANTDDTVLWLDFGRDFYAAQSWSDVADNQRIAIAWMNNNLYANGIPTAHWRGAMSIPRKLQLAETQEGVRLVSKLPDEWKGSYSPVLNESRTLVEKESLQLPTETLVGITKLSLTMPVDSEVEYRPLGNDAISYTFNRDESGIHLTTKRSTLDSNGSDEYQALFAFESVLEIPDSDVIDFVHISDTCSSELHLCGGLYTLTNLVFAPESKGSLLTCCAGTVTVNEAAFCSSEQIIS